CFVFLQLALERRLSDAEKLSGHSLVPVGRAPGFNDCIALLPGQRDDFPCWTSINLALRCPRFAQSCESKVLQMPGQVSKLNFAARRHGHAVLDCVLEFAHIARPVVLGHHAEGIIMDAESSGMSAMHFI